MGQGIPIELEVKWISPVVVVSEEQPPQMLDRWKDGKIEGEKEGWMDRRKLFLLTFHCKARGQ